jgi:hypothetical protein
MADATITLQAYTPFERAHSGQRQWDDNDRELGNIFSRQSYREDDTDDFEALKYEPLSSLGSLWQVPSRRSLQKAPP